MPRPRIPRFVCTEPGSSMLVPADSSHESREPIELGRDEYEALRLVDYLGLYQDAAGEALGVSRQTVGRILASARARTVGALVEGRALSVRGGDAEMMIHYLCRDCSHQWLTFEGGPPSRHCPACGGTNVSVAPEGVGPRGGRRRRGRKWSANGAVGRPGRGGRGGGRGRGGKRGGGRMEGPAR